MKFSLDYDLTYTEAPDLWNNFIDDATRMGHEVMIVTYRQEEHPIEHELNIPVYYTGGMAKRYYMNILGIVIDVWIDDTPDTILQNTIWTQEETEAWLKDKNRV